MTYFFHPQTALKQYPHLEFVEFFEHTVEKGLWQLSPSVHIQYCYVAHPSPKGCIVLFPGRAEALVKYAELIFELYQNGYTVFGIDHRGQGGSSRFLQNRHIGFVDNFDNYVSDAKNCMDKVLMPLLANSYPNTSTQLPRYLLCHSMGAAIGAAFLSAHPEVFVKAAFSSPMFGIKAPLPELLVKWIVKIMIVSRRILGFPIRYFWGQGDYQAYPFHTNRLTNSEARYDIFRQVMAQYQTTQLGGISFEWLYQAILAMQKVRASLSTILIPVLVLQAEQEKIVDNQRMSQAIKSIANVEFHLIEKAQHEILFENDLAKHTALTLILDFFAQAQ